MTIFQTAIRHRMLRQYDRDDAVQTIDLDGAIEAENDGEMCDALRFISGYTVEHHAIRSFDTAEQTVTVVPVTGRQI